MIAQSSFNKLEVTPELAKRVVEKFVRNTKEKFQSTTSKKWCHFKMDVTTLQSKTRKRHIVQARQLAMFFAKTNQGFFGQHWSANWSS